MTSQRPRGTWKKEEGGENKYIVLQMVEWVERGRKTEVGNDSWGKKEKRKEKWPILGKLGHFWPFCLELKSSDQ